MMIRRTSALRQIVLLSRRSRSFHSSAILAGDALDAVDTFARRHSKSLSFLVVHGWKFRNFEIRVSRCIRHDDVYFVIDPDLLQRSEH